MSDAQEPTRGGDERGTGPGAGPSEPVGSVGEEAAKLFGALSDWAREQGGEHAGHSAGAAGAAGAAGVAGAFAGAVKDVNEHLATGGADCRYCPVCQVIHVVRETSPEVRTHLAVAASSLMQAAAGLLATHQPPPSTAPVEKIDLDADWDEDR